MGMSLENRQRQSKRMRLRWAQKQEEMLAFAKKASIAAFSEDAKAKRKATMLRKFVNETPQEREERRLNRKPFSEEAKVRISEGTKRWWEQNRERMLPIAKANFAKRTDESEARRIASVRRYFENETPEQRASRTAPVIHRMKTNPTRGMLGKNHSPETRKRQSESIKESLANMPPEKKRLMRSRQSQAAKGLHVGSKNPAWLGGISKEPYDFAFGDKLKSQVKSRDGYRCVVCGRSSDCLVVHHIDYDKKNSDSDNLVTLCPSCHSKTNFNREHWMQFFSVPVSISA